MTFDVSINNKEHLKTSESAIKDTVRKEIRAIAQHVDAEAKVEIVLTVEDAVESVYTNDRKKESGI